MAIKSPYNFIPLAKEVHFPKWQNVSHDIPIENGLNGTIGITIKNQSDMMLGDSENPNVQYQTFFKTEQGIPAIPGSSIKGMIRSIIEPITASYIDLANQQFAQRNLQNAKNDYMQAMKKSESGWLFWDNHKQNWYIHPTENKHQTIRHSQKTNKNEQNSNTDINDTMETKLSKCKNFSNIETAPERYQLVKNHYPEANYHGVNLELYPNKHLVISNQLSGSSKSREFLFSKARQAKKLTISDKVFNDFLEVMSPEQTQIGNEHWQLLKPQNQIGIPVFFIANGETQISSFGLTHLYRLPYKNRIMDLVGASHKTIKNKTKFDFSNLLFGDIPNKEQQTTAIKGRVNFSLATAKKSDPQYDIRKMLLSNPSATFYPAYLKQPTGIKNDIGYKKYSDDTQISGFKTYLLHKNIEPCQFPTDKEGNENHKVSKMIEALVSKETFIGKLRLHNINAVELGALLWALTLDQKENDASYYHLIGMAKPYGYGKCKITLTNIDIKTNNAQSPQSVDTYINEFYKYCQKNQLNTDILATTKAAHREGLLPDSELRYLSLGAKNNNEFENAKKQGDTLKSIQTYDESQQLKAKTKTISAQIKTDKIMQEKQKLQPKKTNISYFIDEHFSGNLDKKALEKLEKQPELIAELSDEDISDLKDKIIISNYYAGINAKVRKKWRKKLPTIFN